MLSQNNTTVYILVDVQYSNIENKMPNAKKVNFSEMIEFYMYVIFFN